MIAYAFLLLGLVVGPHEIELVVEPPVVRAIVELDGVPIAHLDGPEYRFTFDLGDRLYPHILVAIGLDAAGREVGRAEQRVNVPQTLAHVAILLDGDDPRQPKHGRLMWQHIAYGEADQIDLRLDGQRLILADDGSFAVPDRDPNRLHTVSAALRFGDGSRYRAERSFGGPAGARINIEQTGIPIRAPYGSPSRRQLNGRLQIGGQPASVVAIEKGPAKIVMVVDPGATSALRELAPFDLSTANVGLRAGEQVEFLFPVAERVGGRSARAARLFQKTRPFVAQDGDLAWLLTRVVTPEPRDDQALTDALAAAALAAAEGNRPRAVVMVLSREPTDRSAFRVDEVLDYCRALHVPVALWTIGLGAGGRISEDMIPIARVTPWGSARDITSFNRIVGAISDLRQLLDEQYTVWIEGAHLPSDVTLTGKGRGLELVVEQPLR